MILSNVNIVGDEGLKHIRIENEIITAVTAGKPSLVKNTFQDITIEFENAIAFPGLINSHDHLDFNLFPQTGNRIYKNYADWGHDIHKKNKEAINAVLKVPQALRIQWGLYKNLLNGITTVVNHGEQLDIKNDIITVFQNCYSLHSTRFEKKWKYLLNKPFIKERPFVMHIGEGTDTASHNEIDHLIKWNMFKRKLIGIHGVAMNEKQAASFHALVWCPATNYFLLDKTADIQTIKNKTAVLFGTDSTLTAGWNMWEHIRLAREKQQLSDDELFNSLTSKANMVWKLNKGSLTKNKLADIVIAKPVNNSDKFYSLNPQDIQLIIHNGNIRLFDEALRSQLSNYNIEAFSKIFIKGRCKYVEHDLPLLMKEIRSYYPEASFPIND